MIFLYFLIWRETWCTKKKSSDSAEEFVVYLRLLKYFYWFSKEYEEFPFIDILNFVAAEPTFHSC